MEARIIGSESSDHTLTYIYFCIYVYSTEK